MHPATEWPKIQKLVNQRRSEYQLKYLEKNFDKYMEKGIYYIVI